MERLPSMQARISRFFEGISYTDSMSPLQKKSDGIRRAKHGSLSPEPIRISPHRANSDVSEKEDTPVRTEKTFDLDLARELSERTQEASTYVQEASEQTEDRGRESAIIHEPFARDTLLSRILRKRYRRPTWDTAPRREISGQKTPRAWGWRAGAYGGGIAVAVIFSLLSTVFARLTVTVRPRVEEAAIMRVGILLDTSVSKVLATQKVVPTEVLHFSRAVTREFAASGKAQVEERARGKAMIYNAFNASPQPLVAGTRFETPAGVMYRIQKSVIVPGATIEQGKVAPQGIEAELVSDIAGDGANLSGSVSLRIPGFRGSPRYQGFYATAANGFGGGFRGETIVVMADDLKRAVEEVSKAAFEDVERDMARIVLPPLLLLKELREIEITKVTAPKIGSRATAPFTVSAEAKGTAFAFREQDVIGLLASFALADNTGHEFVPGSARLSYDVRSINFEKGKAEVTIGGILKTKAKIPENELASLIAGKKEGSAGELFKKRAELAGFTFSLFPPWRSTIPADTAKIRFRVENPS